MDKKLLDKVEALLVSYEGNDKFGKINSYRFSYNKKMGTSEENYKLSVSFTLPTKDNNRFGPIHMIDSYDFKEPRHCYLSMVEQLKHELMSLNVKKEIEAKIAGAGELELLRIELDEAIQEENYEEAERIKLEISEIEKQKS